MLQAIQPKTLDQSIAKILYHTECLGLEIDRLQAENMLLRMKLQAITGDDESVAHDNPKPKSVGFSVLYELPTDPRDERLKNPIGVLEFQEKDIRNFAYYLANCSDLEGLKVSVKIFTTEDQPANG